MKAKICYFILFLCPLISYCIPKDTLCTVVIPAVVVVPTTPTCASLQTQTTSSPTSLNISLFGNAAYYGVLAKVAVTGNTPLTIYGSVGSGVSPPTITLDAGYNVYGGKVYWAVDPFTNTALTNLASAYTTLAGYSGTAKDPGFLVLANIVPGIYSFASFVTLGANALITLDPNGVSNAEWVFQINGYLSMGASATVKLLAGGLASNVHWQITGYCSLGASVAMIGNIVANSYISMAPGCTLGGRALSVTDYVTITGVTKSVLCT